MATSTTNLSLVKPALSDNADIAVINTNMDLIDAAVAARETLTGAQTKATTAETNAKAYADTKETAHLADYVRQPGYAVDSGTTNHLIVTLNPAPTSYLDGMGVAVKVKVAGTSATDINVNGLGVKAIYDAFGNAVTNFRANTTYSLKYESISGTFIVQGKGGGGNATAAQLLLGATAATDAGPIVGTMPNRGAVAITPSGSAQGIAAGYHNGSGSVAAVVVPAANVLAGTTIAGTAGTMPNNGAVAMTASNVVQAIAAGYHNGSGTLAAATEVVVPVASVLSGVVIAGQTGTMPNRGAVAITPSGSAQGISAGYHNGSGSVAAVVFTASKVLTGTTIAGTAGTMVSRVGTNLVYTPSTADQTIASGFYGGASTDGKVGAVVVPVANVLTGTTIAGAAGTMPNRGAVAMTPSSASQTIVAGYHSGSGTVAAVTVPAANVLSGTTIAGTAGTMTNRGAMTLTPSTASQTIPAGYHNGSGTVPSISTAGGYTIIAGLTTALLVTAKTGYQTATASGSLTLMSGATIQIRGVVTVKFGFAATNTSTGWAQVYKNGLVAGIYRQSTNQNPTTFSEDFTVNKGDVFTILGNGNVVGHSLAISSFNFWIGSYTWAT